MRLNLIKSLFLVFSFAVKAGVIQIHFAWLSFKLLTKRPFVNYQSIAGKFINRIYYSIQSLVFSFLQNNPRSKKLFISSCILIHLCTRIFAASPSSIHAHLNCDPEIILKMATEEFQVKNYELALSFIISAEECAMKKKVKDSLLLSKIYFRKAGIFLKTYKDSMAEVTYLISLSLCPSRKVTPEFDQSKIRIALSNLLADKGRYPTAISHIEEAVKFRIRSSEYPINMTNDAILGLISLNLESKNVKAADSVVIINNNRFKNLRTHFIDDYFKFRVLQSNILFLKERFNECLDLLRYTEIEILQETDTLKRVLAQVKNNIGNTYLAIGRFSESEKYFSEALKLFTELEGDSSFEVARIMANIGNIYYNTNNYKAAIIRYKESLDILHSLNLEESYLYQNTLSNLFISYIDLGQFNSALPLIPRMFEMAISVNDTMMATDALINMAYAYDELKKPDSALICLSKANQLVLPGDFFPEKSAKILNNTGHIYDKLDSNEQALNYYLEAERLYKLSCGQHSQQYLKAVNNLVNVYWELNLPQMANDWFEKSLRLQRELLENSVFFISENELLTYVKGYEEDVAYNFSYIQKYAARFPELAEMAAEEIFFYKEFVSRQASRIQQSMRSMDSTDLVFKEYGTLKARFYNRFFQNVNPDSAEFVLMEDSLSRLESLVLEKGKKDYLIPHFEWHKVLEKLDTSTSLIEVVRYRKYSPARTDSILYSAVVLNHKSENPVWIDLDIDEKYIKNFSKQPFDFYKLYSNSKEENNLSRYIQDKICTPILNATTTTPNLLISPAGFLYKMNVSLLLNNNLKANHLKEKSVKIISSLQDLDQQNVDRLEFSRVLLVGDITFTNPNLVSKSDFNDKLETANKILYEDTMSYSNIFLRGGGEYNYSPLPFSKHEIENIQYQLEQSKIKTEVFSQTIASEYNLKKSIKENGSPDILHFSTHAFYVPDGEEFKSTVTESGNLDFYHNNDPLLRSGLIMSSPIQSAPGNNGSSNTEDYILTSYEISQLQLDHTKLVVLSACKTGLGDIEGFEGVYGLQRAFRIAGVKNIIMSLWQVDDEATSLLMEDFYRNLLLKKLSVNEALHLAQENIRKQKKFSNPYYWAGWVLLE